MADEITYQCSKCEWDMTAQVHTACQKRRTTPFRVHVLQQHAEGMPLNVRLQCPNKHWSDFPCPIALRDVE